MLKSVMILVGIICVIFLPLVSAEAVTTDQVITQTTLQQFSIIQFTNNYTSDKEYPGLDSFSSNENLEIPTAVKKYELVTFEQQEMNTNLRSTTPHLSFQIDGLEYPADLKRMEFESVDDGIDSYSGTLTGEANSSVLLTISDDATIGSITLNDETYYIEPVKTNPHTEITERIPHIIYSSRDVENREFLIDNGPINSKDNELDVGYQSRTTSSGIEGVLPADSLPDGRTAITVLIVTDNQFYSDHSGYGWKLVAQDIIAEANRQFGRDDIGVILIPIYDDSKRQDLTDRPSIRSNPIFAFGEVYPAVSLNENSADLGLYLGGYDKTIGDDQGSSEGYGNVTHPHYGRHSWAQMVPDGVGYLATTKARRVLCIHELGHQVGAHHDDADTNPELDTPGYNRAYEWGIPLTHQTVMWHYYLETASSYEFSSSWPGYHGDSMHDNARRIRDTKGDVAGYADCSASVPSADFTWTPNPPPASNPVFQKIVFQIAYPPMNNPTYYFWDFGDGSSSSLETPEWSYNWAGTYTVNLTAGNCAGSSITSKEITITPVSSIVSGSGTPTSGYAPLTVQFSSQGSTPTPTSWNWSFGDGKFNESAEPLHEYTESGIFTVTLNVVQDGVENTKNFPDYISVDPQSPHADFTANTTSGSAAPLTVQFTDTSTNAPGTWFWSFGDGSTSMDQNPSHQYLTNGTFTVSLTATNLTSGTSTKTKTNYITVGPLYAETSGNYTILKFNTTGSTKWTPPPGVTTVDYLVVAGGGGGGINWRGSGAVSRYGTDGTNELGGGGGGGGVGPTSLITHKGGSGVVIIRYITPT